MSNLRLLVEKNVVMVGALIVLLGIVITAFSVDISDAESSPANINPDWYVKSYTGVSSLEAPVLLENAVIWHPAGESVLVYERLDEAVEPIRYEWVEGIPRDWRVIQASANGDQHLIWLNTEGRLWRSEINEQGEQLLAPIAVGGFNVVDYGAATLADGLTVIWWQSINGINQSIFMILVDQRGRPLDERQLLQDADQFALTAQSGRIYLTWVNNEAEGAYLLHYTEISINEFLSLASVETLGTSLSISTDKGEWIDMLHIVHASEETHVIWGVMGMDSPDHTDFQGIVWERGAIETEPRTFALHVENEDTKLRWIGRVTSRQNVAGSQLVLNAFLNGQWRAVLVAIESGNVTSYEVIADIEANASRAHVWIEADWQITAAWARIQENNVIQQVVSNRTDLRSSQDTPATDESSFAELLLKWFLSLPYGVLWLLMPMAVLIRFERNQAIGPALQIIVVLIVYWLGKLLMHGDVLNTPPSFEYTDSDAVAVGVALGSSALVAGAIAQRIWRMDFDWRTVLAVFLISDMVMTFLIFGANLD